MNYNATDTAIAKKYAKAFINVFGHIITSMDLSKIETAQKFLSLHRRVLFFLQLPQLNESLKQSMIEDIVGYFSLPHQFVLLLSLLVSHNRSFFIPNVLFFVQELYKLSHAIEAFSIVSSHALCDKQRERIRYFLSSSTGASVICSYSIDKWLIAGIRMQSVDHMWEYSVRKQLLCLRTLAKVNEGR